MFPKITFESNRNKKIFIAIIVVASLLRLAFLSRGPVFGDEPFYLLRGYGWVDALCTTSQRTPIEIANNFEWWFKLSFHDHPPLTFIINHLFFSVFGYSVFVGRLSSALFDIVSVCLVFLIGRKVVGEKAGLLASALYAVNACAVNFARSALMESITILFILLVFYLFIISLERIRYLYVWGLFFGLSILAKYTSFVLMPVYLIYLAIYQRNYYLRRELYGAFFLAIVIFSPVIVYNVMLYRMTGHFDVQFATLFHQNTPEWPLLLGKEMSGELKTRLLNMIWIVGLSSPVFTLSTIMGFALFIIKFIKTKCRNYSGQILVFFSILAYLFFLLLVGSHIRFMAYTIPFLCFISANFLIGLFSLNFKKKKVIICAVLIVFFSYELFFNINTNILPIWRVPVGNKIFLFSKNLAIMNDSGADNLKRYFDERLIFKAPYLFSGIFLENKNHYSAMKNKQAWASIYPVALFFDADITAPVMYYALAIKNIYEGWYSSNICDISGIVASSEIVDSLDIYLIRSVVGDKFSATFCRGTSFNINSFFDKLDEEMIKKDIINNNRNEARFVVYTLKKNVLRDILTGMGVVAPTSSLKIMNVEVKK